MKTPLRIYMGDLTHDTLVLVSDTIPINIGYIAAYLKKTHGQDVEISLFKFPKTIIDAIKTSPPDVVALSNYSWNSNLSEHVAGLAKECNPKVLTVQGGTNFPHRPELQKEFLLTRPNTDIHIELEAEVAFSELIGRFLAWRDGGPGVFDAPAIPGCVYIVPETRNTKDPQLVVGPKPSRIKNLDDIPSPYLTGNLDKFFDGRLTPFMETNRGCPFTCSFCHTGNDYYTKINMYSLDRIIEEIKYIAPRMKELGITNLHLADTNFAMYPRDKDICEMFVKSREQWGWPVQIMSTTGKNNKERIIEVTQILGTTFAVNMSVQSMDPVVLANIKRSNIKLDHYTEVNRVLNERGRATKGEVIIGLPGETRESFTRGIKNILNAGVSSICSYSLMLLHGTSFKEPSYREEFGIQGKYRIVPLNFGEYGGQRVFDIEETGIANKHMSFEDYLWIRGLSLMIEVLHNSRPFQEFFHYGSQFGLTFFEFMMRVYQNLEKAPKEVKAIVDGFLGETRSELWDSEEELVAHYRKDENYQRLLHGDVGGNLIYKYKALSLAYTSGPWVDFLVANCKEIANENIHTPQDREAAARELDTLAEFVRNKLHGLLNVEAEIVDRHMKSSYDIVAWKKSPLGTPLSKFMLPTPIVYDFVYTDEQLRVRKDSFKRYGTSTNALSKIVTRVSNVESLFRKIAVRNVLTEQPTQELDQFVRYSQSN